jgi:hypothetical protein
MVALLAKPAAATASRLQKPARGKATPAKAAAAAADCHDPDHSATVDMAAIMKM